MASEHTFAVDRHGRSTDHILARDELHKAAYRAGKSFDLVAATELAETRADLAEACAEVERLRQILEREKARRSWEFDRLSYLRDQLPADSGHLRMLHIDMLRAMVDRLLDDDEARRILDAARERRWRLEAKEAGDGK